MKTCSGLFTALVTPFKEGKLDETALISLLRKQEEACVDGIVLLGSTGEAPTLTIEEKKRILHLSRKTLPQAKLIAGAGSPSTQMSIDYAHMAEDEGMNALLVVTPYYNKPNQEGIVCHFEHMVRSTTLPIIAYSNASRAGINIEVNTVKKLAEIEQMIGIKEASNNMIQIMAILNEVKPKRKDFAVVAGDDPLAFPMMSLGADGVICTASNLFPKKMKALVEACQTDLKVAKDRHFQLFGLFQALSSETNPIPIKAALSHFGFSTDEVRLPLMPLNDEKKKKLIEFLKGFS